MNKTLIMALALATSLAVNAQHVSQTILVDFGDVKDGRGLPTEGADANGNYWTNVKTSGNNYMYPGITFPVINTKNEDTGYDILVNTRFMSNGTSAAGGYLNPDKAVLGDMAIESATYDYIFVENFQDYNFITFRNLDPRKAYRFHTFGSRTDAAARITCYTFRGLNSWSENHQTSGSGIGTGGYNGNNNHVGVSDPIFPDENGCITFTMNRVQGMLHINTMKIEELDDVEYPDVPYTLSQTMYIDLGENTEHRNHGLLTEGADVNGHYWNNIHNTSGDQIPAGTVCKLVNSRNEDSGLTAKTLHQMATNGTTAAGGVENPTAENLRDLAIRSATMDYVYINTVDQAQIEFTGADPDKAYRIHAFGSRITDETGDRNGFFIFEGSNSWQAYQWFSGRCIGGRDSNGKDVHGNIRNVAVSEYIYPDANGRLVFTLKRNTGLAHLNVLKLEEFSVNGEERPVGPMSTLTLCGTAAEGGNELVMTALNPTGASSGNFVAYTMLQPGQLSFKGVNADEEAYNFGVADGKLLVDGEALTVEEAMLARIYVNTRESSVAITPITSLAVKGSIVPDGTVLEYQGNGLWQSEVVLDRQGESQFVNRSIYFALNGDDNYAIRRTANSYEAGVAADGFSGENIRLNNGTYTFTVDLAKGLIGIDAPVNAHRVSVFGSSVANGQGATDFQGYAYLYGKQLNDRYTNGLSENPFHTSGVSIGGNTTKNLLNRYDDVIHDFGHYVMIGLSLGNEGIHGSANQEAVFNQFRDNMLTLIEKLRADGKEPVVVNNYTRGDYDIMDYIYVKAMNMLIHQWDVPSVNVLGAIDDGMGRWSTGYIQDNAHPNTSGHVQFMQAIVPSLFDALIQGKQLPERVESDDYMTLANGAGLKFTPEGKLNAFTADLRLRGAGQGTVMKFVTGFRGAEAKLAVNAEGKIVYTPASGTALATDGTLSDTDWTHLTFTHYYAQGMTYIYADGRLLGSVKETLLPGEFTIGDPMATREVAELSFWRSGMNADEIQAHVDGKMMKSSLEIYSPCSVAAAYADTDSDATLLPNLAQSLNAVEYVPAGTLGVSAPVATDVQLEAVGGKGAIRISGAEGTVLTVASVDGRVLFSGRLNASHMQLPAAAGVYLVNNIKVVVK